MGRASGYVFFFNDTATTEIYTLSLHDALPILRVLAVGQDAPVLDAADEVLHGLVVRAHRSEEHTSELQSRQYLVCRLLLEKKKSRRLVELIAFTLVATRFACRALDYSLTVVAP